MGEQPPAEEDINSSRGSLPLSASHVRFTTTAYVALLLLATALLLVIEARFLSLCHMSGLLLLLLLFTTAYVALLLLRYCFTAGNRGSLPLFASHIAGIQRVPSGADVC